jgi:predicted DNA binding CopG/RHH family protein
LEADWWAGKQGREYVKRESAKARAQGLKFEGSPLLRKIAKKNTVQIAIRLPEADLAEARRLADRKGIGYQTLLKMLVHEGLTRERRRG